MLYEEKKLLIYRIVFGILFVAFLITPIIIGNISEMYDAFLYIKIFAVLDVWFFVGFINTLTLSCKKYVYEGKEILIYTGWYHHYIEVDGVRVDEHNTIIFFSAIIMSCTLDDGTELKATVSLTNRVSLKINDKLYTGKKH